MAQSDAPIVIIGAGHNSLTAAFYLAKAGHKTIVLEARQEAGGCAALSHNVALRPSVVKAMGLGGRVQFVEADPRLVTLSRDGRALAFSRDSARTTAAIRAFSPNDAAKYVEFSDTLARLGRFLGDVLEMTPPSLDAPSAGDMWSLLKTGRQFRALGKDGFRLLRWGPMAAADLVGEWFSDDLVQAAVAARGIFGTEHGPWSAGTGAVLLLNAAVDPAPGGSSVTVKGGVGVLTRAMADAAREAGAEIRLNAPVARVHVKDGRASGVLLHDGTEIAARAVVSGADPRRTFLELVDPVELDPSFLQKVRNYRARGTVAVLHVDLASMPQFRGVSNPADLRGRIQIGPGIDYLERAFDASKYGGFSDQPYLDMTMPTLSDEARADGKHMLSVHMQFAPYTLRDRTWDSARDDLTRTILQTLEQFAPGILRIVERTTLLTPVDLEKTYGLSGGHIYHGEPSLDQLFTMRPIIGHAQYRAPIDGLYLCGGGTHPGGGLTAGSGQNAAREILRDLRRRSTSGRHSS
jgi:phytoene dehydrogenase-like protein